MAIDFGTLGHVLADLVSHRADKNYSLVECDDPDLFVDLTEDVISNIEDTGDPTFNSIILDQVKNIMAMCAEVLMRHHPEVMDKKNDTNIENDSSLIKVNTWYHTTSPLSKVYDYSNGRTIIVTNIKKFLTDDNDYHHFIDQDGYGHTVIPGWISCSEVPYVPPTCKKSV